MQIIAWRIKQFLKAPYKEQIKRCPCLTAFLYQLLSTTTKEFISTGIYLLWQIQLSTFPPFKIKICTDIGILKGLANIFSYFVHFPLTLLKQAPCSFWVTESRWQVSVCSFVAKSLRLGKCSFCLFYFLNEEQKGQFLCFATNCLCSFGPSFSPPFSGLTTLAMSQSWQKTLLTHN